ncbi:MAG: outer membrane protein assembly factor BamE [Burkholderiaceae bacterium]|nr:outer membrane protein assembly factor BamE [Burkholderiaceae bacterium]
MHSLRSAPLRRGPRRATAWPAAALLAAGLAGCGVTQPFNLVNVFRPYRVEIVQGNVITKERAERVEPGMTRAQVRDILGTPLLTDIFHADRWDYTFLLNRPGTPTQLRVVVAYFEGDSLTRLEAPDLPTEAEFLNLIQPYRQRGDVPKLALTEEQIKALPVPPRVETAASAPEGPTRDYPPLEPRG